MNAPRGTRDPHRPSVQLVLPNLLSQQDSKLQSGGQAESSGKQNACSIVGLAGHRLLNGTPEPLSLTGEGVPSGERSEAHYGPRIPRPFSDLEGSLADEWRAFLGRYRWSQFLTVSFREPQRPGKAISILGAVSKTLRPWFPRRLFLATEPHKTGLLHLHGLVSLSDDQDKRLACYGMWEALYRRYGLSRVDRVESVGGVTGYITKYVTKGIGEWTMGD